MKKPGVLKNMGRIQKIAVPPRVDTAMLTAHGWSKDQPSVRFEFKKTLKLADLPPVKIPADSLLRLGCSAAGKKPGYSAKAVPAAGIESRAPRNFAELKKVNRIAHRVYLKAWGAKVGGFFLISSKEYETKYLPKTRSLIMFRKGRPVALYSLLKYSERGKVTDIVTWHNPFVRLTPAEVRSVWHQAACWMNSAAKYRLGVGLDYFDKASLRFFSGLGFRVNRIRIVRI